MKELHKSSSLLPRSGELPSYLNFVDGYMVDFMKQFDTSAGILALTHNGSVLVDRSYGWKERDHTVLLQPQTRMRYASLTKPITAAATKQLVRGEKFTEDTEVFPYLGIETKNAQTASITVAHLLQHTGGWDMVQAGFDPVFQLEEIKKELHISSVTPEDVIMFVADKPLQFTPGERESYSNIGYCILGRMIEKASGKPYIRYIQEDLLTPIGITNMACGKTKEADRLPDEVWYEQTAESPHLPYGEDFDLTVLDSVGGLSGSAADYAQFMNQYLLSGDVREKNQKVSYQVAFGSLPGTKTMAIQRPDGLNLVTLFNRRFNPQSDILETMMNTMLDRVSSVA